jgi:hypothetical protein
MHQYIAPMLLAAALTACESMDDYVGQTFGDFSGKPKSRLAAKPLTPQSRMAPQSSNGATTKFARKPVAPRQVPSGRVVAIKSAQARLLLPLRVLNGGTVARRRFTSANGRYIEEDALWTGPVASPVTAGMLLSESRAGPPVTDAEDPAETANHWAAFRGKRKTFGDLVGSNNVLGPVLWRRSRAGATACVVFLQRWHQSPPAGPASLLSGFYCNAPGDTLSPGEAETVVQSIGITALAR